MKGRDKRRQVQKRRQREEEHRRLAAVPQHSERPAGDGHQQTNGKRLCKWDQRLLDISVCIVRQHRSGRTCFGCTWYNHNDKGGL
jgi:hypothetical protein